MAQAFSSFDTYLAPFVKVDNLTYREVKQCIQSFIYGVNTPSRWGCVDTDTEVLSTDGFKKYNELKEHDLIYTWNNGKLELNEVRKVIVKPYIGKLHEYSNKSYNQTVTPNHRMLVRKHNSDEYEIKLSEDIFDVKTPYALPTRFYGTNISGIDITDDEVIMAAFVYADGSIELRNGNVHKIKIHKSPNRYGNEKIIELSNSLGLEYTTSKHNGEYGDVNVYTYYSDSARKLFELVGSKYKIADKFCNLNSRQSKLFLDSWALFDGDETKMLIQCDNNDIVDSVQHIALRAGYTTYIKKYKKTTYVKFRQNGHSTYPTSRKEIDYNGLVWCPNVENGTAVFRKNGNVFISGQTQAPFTNVTLDWTVPADLAIMPAIVGGKDMDFTYGDCKKEMDMVNKAFIEIMIEGDANGRGFQYPIPTYSITKDFDWSETENNKLLFEMTSKYGTPYFSNYINSDMSPSDSRSMCCRLRLDLRELRKKSGGYFGSGESTGSVGVVTINLPRLGYLAKDEKDFYEKLDKIMDISARSLKIKRDVVTNLLEQGLYPYAKRYLGTFNNHFSTMATIGMNEMCLNAKWLNKDMTHVEAQEFTKEVLNHMRERLSDYQELYGDLYNLEAAPAESTTYRLAKHDKKLYPNIITANGDCGTPYYTNSSHLPVDYTADIFEALDIQDDIQTLYTSGTVFHGFLGEKLPDWKAALNLVRKIAENYKLPYYTLSPTYSVCKNHGYISGEKYECDDCGEKTEVYSRITGYYRPVQNWNDGKLEEFNHRKTYNKFEYHNHSNDNHSDIDSDEDFCDACQINYDELQPEKSYKLFATKTCPKCKVAAQLLEKKNIEYEKVYVEDNTELAKSLELKQAPTLVILENDLVAEKIQDLPNIKSYIDNI